MFRLHLHLYSFISIILALIVIYLIYAISNGQFCYCSKCYCPSDNPLRSVLS